MKEFKVNMTKGFSNLASKSIRTKHHIIELLLESISLLTYGEITERPVNDHIILRIDKMSRLFFVSDKKIFSFNFPFSVEVMEEGKNPIIYDLKTEIEISGVNLAVLRSVYDEIFNEKDALGILDLDSTLIHIMDTFETKPNKDQLWLILQNLLVFESGYLRYDYDEEHQNGELHPLNHLDINYSSDITFKIGLRNIIDSYSLIDILDVNTKSYFIT